MTSKYPRPKIVLLFLTITDVHFPGIWDEWLRGNEDKVDIFIHPKYPSDCVWRTDRILPESDLEPTEWGQIVYAYAALFRGALRYLDPPASYSKYITLSESDVPIRSFDDVYAELTADPTESMYTRMRGPSEWDKSVRLKQVPAQQTIVMVKHNARFALCSDHARQFADVYRRESTNEFSMLVDVSAGDEFCLTPLLVQRIPGSRVRFTDRPVTHDNWVWTNAEVSVCNREIRGVYDRLERLPRTPRGDAQKAALRAQIKVLQQARDTVRKNPKTIVAVTPADVADIRAAQSRGALFYRKFGIGSNVADYYKMDW